MAIGTAVSVAGAMSSARAQANAANYNAAVASRNAAIARQQTAQDLETQQRQARMQIGAMRAAYGASGVTPEGSPLDVLEQSASAAELDAQNIKYRGELKALGYSEEASLDSSQAGSALAFGNQQSASALLTGATQGLQYYNRTRGN